MLRKILISAYACEPQKGSEPAVGWNWVLQVAKFAEVWVITRTNNKEVIEAELKNYPKPNLHFVYVDLPKWMRFWKKGQKGVHLYYLLWQLAAYFKAKELTKIIKYDISHHITFVNDWLPSFLAFLPIPFVWGPIGSHPPIPIKFIMPNKKGIILEIIMVQLRIIFRILNPAFYITVFRAKAIIMIHSSIRKRFPFIFVNNNKIFYKSAIGMSDRINHINTRNRNEKKVNIISVGRLVYFKGFHLALFAISKLLKKRKDISITIIGDGMDRKFLRKLSKKMNIDKHVTFFGNVSREIVIKTMITSDIFLFPSFEGGGMVVLEAMACGLPVVCLDYGGPGEMVTNECGIKIKPRNYDQTIKDLADALLRLADNPELRKKMGDAGKKRVFEYYLWEKKGEFIKRVYDKVLQY
jgi:glycosyltransferase involved in cell wall biosynthesis